MSRVTVALVFGGRSSEHTISCVTAAGVLSAIDRGNYNVIPIGITRDGAYTLQNDDPDQFALNPQAMPEVRDNGTRVIWPDSSASREFRYRDAAATIHSLGDIDIVFPILHGPWGEDGTIQGMLELIGIPYVGNGVLASALGMDKHFTKTALAAAGVSVAPWVTLNPREWLQDRELFLERVKELGLPLFVKPARAGSSMGVTKVTSLDGLDDALVTAFAEDSRALIESAVSGREVECGVLSGREGAAVRVSVPGEIIVRGREFYDFEAKYIDPASAELVCPAVLEPDQLSEMQRVAARAFDAIGGSGLARIDFFFTGSEFVVNEINTMPGFTPISMYPRCWQESGMSYRDLIGELIQLGLETER